MVLSYRYIEAYSVADGVFLVLTNLSVLPALWISIKLRRYAMVSLFAIVMLVSSAHHTCGSFGACLSSPQCLCATDHFFVYISIIWIGLFMFGVEGDIAAACVIPAMAIAFPLSITHPYEIWSPLIPVATATVIALCVRVYARNCNVPEWDRKDAIFCVIFFTIGALVFVGSNQWEDNRAYPWLHGIWHILSMLGCYFAIEIRDGKSVTNKVSNLWTNLRDGVRSWIHKRMSKGMSEKDKQKAGKKQAVTTAVSAVAVSASSTKTTGMQVHQKPFNRGRNQETRRRTHAYIGTIFSAAILIGLLLYNVLEPDFISFNKMTLLFPNAAAVGASLAAVISYNEAAVSTSAILLLISEPAVGVLLYMCIFRLIQCNNGSDTGHTVEMCATETFPLWICTFAVAILAVFNAWLFINASVWMKEHAMNKTQYEDESYMSGGCKKSKSDKRRDASGSGTSRGVINFQV